MNEHEKHEEARRRVEARAVKNEVQQEEHDAVEPMPLDELEARFKLGAATNNKEPNGWVATHEGFLKRGNK